MRDPVRDPDSNSMTRSTQHITSHHVTSQPTRQGQRRQGSTRSTFCFLEAPTPDTRHDHERQQYTKDRADVHEQRKILASTSPQPRLCTAAMSRQQSGKTTLICISAQMSAFGWGRVPNLPVTALPILIAVVSANRPSSLPILVGSEIRKTPKGEVRNDVNISKHPKCKNQTGAQQRAGV